MDFGQGLQALGAVGTGVGAILGGPAAPIVSAAGTALSSLGSIFGGGTDYKKAYKYWKYGYERQRKGNMEDWMTQTNYVNSYNSPTNTVQRLLEAGLNPNLAYNNAQGWHSAAAPSTVNGGTPGISVISSQAQLMQALAQMRLTDSQTNLNNAKAKEAEQNTRNLQGDEERAASLFPFIVQGQQAQNDYIKANKDKALKETSWIDKFNNKQIEFMDTQMANIEDMIGHRAAERNIWQSRLDLDRERWQNEYALSWYYFNETQRVNDSTIAKNYADAAEGNARSLLTHEQYTQLHKQGLIDYDPSYGYLFPVPDGIASAELKRQLPKGMTGLVTTINGKPYIQISNQLASTFTDAQISQIQKGMDEMLSGKQAYENRHKSSHRIWSIISGVIPFASGVAAGSGTQIIRGAQQPKPIRIKGF